MADLSSLLRDVLQGASNSAAGTVSGPVDLIAWLLRQGGVDTGTPVGGSDWMTERGLMKQPDNKWAGLLGETAGAILPMAGSRQGVNALLKMQENAAAPATLSKQRGILAGQWARTANNDAREKAIELLDAGVDNREVYKRTQAEFGQGWFKGPDGKLRFEIPDNTATMDSTGNFLGRKGGGGTVGQVMNHPDLAAAYPESQNITTRFEFDTAEKVNGSFSDFANHITVDNPLGAQNSKDVLLHELQHYAQMREGFAMGGSPQEFASGPMFDKKAKSLSSDLSKLLTGSLSAKPDELRIALKYADPAKVLPVVNEHGFSSIDDAMKFLRAEDTRRTPFGQYQRLAGEAEARAVQARMNMTPAERAATFPLDSYDVPLDQLIFRNAGLLGASR